MTTTTHERARVLTVKLDPSPEQWRRLRDLAWQSMQYRNAFVRARWAESIGLRPHDRSDDKAGATKKVRAEEKADLSGSAYSAAEREVQAVWTRDGKRIMAGAPLPQWRQADSLAIRGHKNRNESGVRIEDIQGGFFADLQVQGKDSEGGSWLRIPIAKGTETDDWQAPKLREMARGLVPVLKGVVCFKVRRGKTLLRLAYQETAELPPMGKRVATLGPVNPKSGRLLLGTETQTIDYTSRLVAMRERKESMDLARRRISAQIGRRRGHARAKRRALARFLSGDWQSTHLHQWTRDIINWCETQGVGQITVLDLAGGDWPAHQFVQMLKYKAADANMIVVEQEQASLADEATARAAKREVERKRRKAKKFGEATREIAAQLNPTERKHGTKQSRKDG